MLKIEKFLSKTPYKDFHLTVASADASFRKYYRLRHGGESVLLMDASLEKNSLTPFLDVLERLLAVGSKAPRVLVRDLEAGYLILEDFGSTHYLDLLNEQNFKQLYLNAIDEILKMQEADVKDLPLYDKEFLLFEMGLMEEWYFKGLLGAVLTEDENAMLAETLNTIADVVLSQPQGLFVHRDFHSRNIMLTAQNEIGVIDFQDAMCGALTYDLVSLLKDCYIAFEPREIEALALTFRDKKGINATDAEFLKWFDFMGLQRHIKVLGVFARLSLRDGKDGYLKDIPLVLRYTLEAAKKYEETQKLAMLLERLTQDGK